MSPKFQVGKSDQKGETVQVQVILIHLARGQGVGRGGHWRVLILLFLNIVKTLSKSSASQNYSWMNDEV